jgi:hypothetical protein
MELYKIKNFEMFGHGVPNLKQRVPQYVASFYLVYLRVDAVSLDINRQFVEVHETLVTSWE